MLQQDPQHPGVAHYLVHAYDYPPLADKGIKIAVDATRASRRRRRTRATCRRTSIRWWGCGRSRSPRTGRRSRSSPTTITRPTSSVYAHLQLAQDAQGQGAGRHERRDYRARRRPGPILGDFTAVAAMPARYVLERGDWAGAAALPVVRDRTSTGRLARALRARARHGAAAAIWRERRARSRRCRSCAPRWRKPSQTRTGPIAPRSRCSPSPRGWRYAEGKRDEALKLMRAAADSEDASVKHVAMENRLYPMRELLGELLLAAGAGRGGAARVRGLAEGESEPLPRLSTARRARPRLSGDRQKAVGYYEKLVALAVKADTARPEITRAKTFLAR